ncbi:MAG: glycerol-3-phosphate dehydrogenase/oxidase [Planctomycetota bacterium]
MNRNTMLASLRARSEQWDLVIIGGGATGLGTAVDAASRGLATVLLEGSDFAKGTSSRSTKLIHGGVRYLQQGNVSLVMEALRERGRLLRNAPHLVQDVAFIVPSYKWWESPFYGIGMKVYDLLAGRYGFGRSSIVSQSRVVQEIPSIQTEGLIGGTRYFDGQFDDARLAINLASTAAEHGATLLNYAPVTGLLKDEDGSVSGVRARDDETGDQLEARARVVVNATGPFADEIRRLDHAGLPPVIAPSTGVHIVLDRSFLPGDSAIMVPHTDDGRVMFAIPWHEVAVVGTTDTPVDAVELEPVPRREDVEFILDTANRYLSRPATAGDIRSVFVGIRPLVKLGDGESTAALSRDHTLLIDPHSGLMTVAGGKWTTYRKMAEDVVDQATTLGGLSAGPCITKDLRIHGYDPDTSRHGPRAFYGSDADEVARLVGADPSTGVPIHDRLGVTEADVRWACRNEMARTVDDVLARRTRSLLFDARAAIEASPRVAEIMASELGLDEEWGAVQIETFSVLAQRYVYPER